MKLTVKTFFWKINLGVFIALSSIAFADARASGQDMSSASQALPDAPDVVPTAGTQPLHFVRVLNLVPIALAPSLEDSKVTALSKRQKFEFFARTAIDPGTAVVGLIGAGFEAKSSMQPAYGGGAPAFFQKTGAVAARQRTCESQAIGPRAVGNRSAHL